MEGRGKSRLSTPGKEPSPLTLVSCPRLPNISTKPEGKKPRQHRHEIGKPRPAKPWYHAKRVWMECICQKNTVRDRQSISLLPACKRTESPPAQPSPPNQDGSKLTGLKVLNCRGMKRFNAVFKRGLSGPPKRLKRQIAYHHPKENQKCEYKTKH